MKNLLNTLTTNFIILSSYCIGDIRGVGDVGLILLGNINSYLMNENKNMFSDLPAIFQESALLDRFHGFIKGWTIPKMNENLKADNWALNTEYFEMPSRY